MTSRTLSDISRFKIVDEQTGQVFLGYDQEWYGATWRQRAGCGPTTACNLLRYLMLSRPGPAAQALSGHRADASVFMDELWQFVTPTNRGVSTTKLFYTSVLAYAQSQAWHLSCRVYDVPAESNHRPPLDDLVRFLDEALSQDLPIAFLNLCNGTEACLDEWHWVTIIALTDNRQDDGLTVQVLDNGKVKRIDLVRWYATTTRDGGFVVIVPGEPSREPSSP